jgi:hypothetical protein
MSKFEKLLEFISYLRIKGDNGKLFPMVLLPHQKEYLKYLVENEK